MRCRRAIWEIFRFEAIWKLLCLINPLFRDICQAYASSSGPPVPAPNTSGVSRTNRKNWAKGSKEPVAKRTRLW